LDSLKTVLSGHNFKVLFKSLLVSTQQEQLIIYDEHPNARQSLINNLFGDVRLSVAELQVRRREQQGCIRYFTHRLEDY
jgi:hypothetical protein